MKITGAELIVRFFEQQGIDKFIGIPGGANLPIYDALYDSNIEVVLARHEQAAGFISQGIARITGQPSVCIACSGPGATNLVTAVADAKMDSIPLIAITGQVPTALIGTDAFQETDTKALMKPITKACWMAESVEELVAILPEAWAKASEGRPGPVAIDVPKDVQQAWIELNELPQPPEKAPAKTPETDKMDEFIQRLSQAERPVFMVGGGVIQANAANTLKQLAETWKVPVTTTFMGLGILPSDHPLNLGMLGMHGAPYTNLTLDACDLLVGIGVRFDDRATGKVSAFCPNAKIIHIDIDARELGKIIQPDLAIHAELGAFLSEANTRLRPDTAKNTQPWLTHIDRLKQQAPLPDCPDTFIPFALLHTLSEATDHQATIVTDVGQHQMWTAQAYPFQRPRQWLSSGGLGTMGFGLPAAIGAAMADPTRPVLCISGDGSFLMNLQEIDTLVEHQLNIKIIILNNQHLGLVRQQQHMFYRDRRHSTGHKNNVDFASVAEAMGAKGYRASCLSKDRTLLEDACKTPGPCLIDFAIDENALALPIVPGGSGNVDMVISTAETLQKKVG